MPLPGRTGPQGAGETGGGEILRISGKAETGMDQRRPKIWGIERGVGERRISAYLGMAADDRVGAVGVAFRLRSRALRVA